MTSTSNLTTPAWSTQYSIGSELVDSQHQRLFELLAMLVDADRGACEDSVVDHAINGLYGYIRFHFSDEERLMEELRYPGLDAHRKLHDAFILGYDDLVTRHRSSNDFLPKLIHFINAWLLNHIMTEDTKIRSGH